MFSLPSLSFSVLVTTSWSTGVAVTKCNTSAATHTLIQGGGSFMTIARMTAGCACMCWITVSKP